MKEATGEGSMSIITILVIVGVAALAVGVIAAITSKAQDTAETAVNSSTILKNVQDAASQTG